MTEQYQRLHVIVEGIVQGVGFRFFVFNHGLRLNLNGWVRNRINGSVEILAEGPHRDLETFLDLIQQGPPSAKVDKTTINWSASQHNLPRFTVQMDG